ncbi:MAG TPA: MFS transporter [Alphaproteobacteria bacterium]|nr:MFS transporter [Alphaproteobacteria bacterium]
MSEPPVIGTPPPSADDGYPSSAYGWYVVFILFFAYTIAFVDRQIMAFLVDPIRHDLAITDFEFSLLQGLAFAIFYGVLGIPIGRLADSRNRRNIIATGVFLWSIMTGVCGLASSFWHLFMARLGVGVGEAALSPSAISMISDYFPKEKRGLPINLYAAGVQVGAGLANIFGGAIAALTAAAGGQEILMFGTLKPWQLAFILVSLPGFLVVLLTFTIREPVRREKRSATGGVTLGEALGYVRKHWVVYATLMLGAAFSAMAGYGAFSWAPTTFRRVYGWNMGQIGLDIGLITIVCGTFGLLFSGWLAGIMLKRGHIAAYSTIMIVAMCGTVPPALLFVAVPSPYWTLGCLTLMVLFLSAPVGLVQAALQAVTPNEMRGQVIAVYLVMVTIFGVGLGPSAVSAITDFVFANDAAVGHSISAVSTVAALISAGLLIIGVPAYKRRATAEHA